MSELVATARPRRARRFDPDRKDRIIDAALDVIADHGVRGTTHRLIAAAADVPLGSLTYHFAGLDDLLIQAFTRHAGRMATAYERHFDGVRTRADLVEAIANLVLGADADRDSAINFELYLAAVHNPELRNVTQGWMETSRAVLHRFLDPVTARGVDALIEGLIIHRILSTAPVDRSDTIGYIDRALRSPTTDPTNSDPDNPGKP
jgi:TetR/AcrR family transcriptional regulator, regulator of biofilm formation and stress response